MIEPYAATRLQKDNPPSSPAISVNGNTHSIPKYASTGSPSSLPISISGGVRLVVRWKSQVFRSRSADTDRAQANRDQKVTSPHCNPNNHLQSSSHVCWLFCSRNVST